jgi:Golgi phosphoprotein 3
MQTLAEDLLLLALDDDNGTVPWQHSTALPHGLGGALLMDLVLQGRIDVVGKKVVVTSAASTGDDILDEALVTIGESKRRHDAKHWVSKLGGRSGLKEQLARRLVERGILEEQEKVFLWVFRSNRYPTSNPEVEASLRQQIHDVVLSGEDPDVRTLMLLSLVHACDLGDVLFTRDERKRAKQRIKELVEGEKFGKAVGEVISEITDAAVIAATTVMITTSSSN